MESESIVYGCIRDWPSTDAGERALRHANNQQALAQLPAADAWPLLGREMFSLGGGPGEQSQVIHFGASYQAIEYEWALWVKEFEALLKRLYWASAVVHLETELNGLHTFRWESESGCHSPEEDGLRMRCVWEREGGVGG